MLLSSNTMAQRSTMNTFFCFFSSSLISSLAVSGSVWLSMIAYLMRLSSLSFLALVTVAQTIATIPQVIPSAELIAPTSIGPNITSCFFMSIFCLLLSVIKTALGQKHYACF